MRKYLVILSLYLIPVFSCQGNSVIEPVRSIVPTPSQSIINVIPLPSVISSPSVLLTPSPKPSTSEIPIMIDQAMIDYPDDYNQEESPKVIYSNRPIPDSIKNDKSIIIYESGVVSDRNNNPIADADITIMSPIYRNDDEYKNNYYIYGKTKTDGKGFYGFNAYNGFRINIFVSKKGFTSRKISSIPSLVGEEGGTDKYYFGGFYDLFNQDNKNKSIYRSINNEPEITAITVNNQLVKLYNIQKIPSVDFFNVYQRIWILLSNPYTELSRFKVKSTDKLELEISFNKSINTKSIEDNIQIKSLDGIDIYDKNTKDIVFNWFDNNSKLNVIIPITEYNVDKKYRLSFKNTFTDLEGHQSYKEMLICLYSFYGSSTSELSENIVFSIAGNKGN